MIKLYHLDPDADWLGGARNGAKITIALRELELPHEVVYISRRHDMRDPTSHFRTHINAWGTVPVLQDEGFILRESATIMRYLSDLVPDNRITSKDPKAKALEDQWLTWECSMYVPSLLEVIRLGRYDGVASDTDKVSDAQRLFAKKAQDPVMSAAVERWNANVKILDEQLASNAYVAGRYSLADLALGCSVPIGPLFGMTLTPYPNVVAWLNRLESRAPWQEERTFILDMQSGKKGGLIPCSESERARIEERRWAAF